MLGEGSWPVSGVKILRRSVLRNLLWYDLDLDLELELELDLELDLDFDLDLDLDLDLRGSYFFQIYLYYWDVHVGHSLHDYFFLQTPPSISGLTNFNHAWYSKFCHHKHNHHNHSSYINYQHHHI